LVCVRRIDGLNPDGDDSNGPPAAAGARRVAEDNEAMLKRWRPAAAGLLRDANGYCWGGGGAPPGGLGNHSHREGAMPPSRPQMSQPQTFIFIFIQLMKKVSRMQKELTSLLFKSCEICRHSHDYIPLTWLIISRRIFEHLAWLV